MQKYSAERYPASVTHHIGDLVFFEWTSPKGVQREHIYPRVSPHQIKSRLPQRASVTIFCLRVRTARTDRDVTDILQVSSPSEGIIYSIAEDPDARQEITKRYKVENIYELLTQCQ